MKNHELEEQLLILRVKNITLTCEFKYLTLYIQ